MEIEGDGDTPTTEATAFGSDSEVEASDSDDDFEEDSDAGEPEGAAHQVTMEWHDSIDLNEDFAFAGPSPPMSPYSLSRRDETLLIFDWDDTLLPSTFIQQAGLKLTDDSQPTEEQWEQLRIVSLASLRTLKAAKRLARVVIVTNAERGWVEMSCRKFSPWLYHALDGVRVLSARSQYEQPGVTSPFEWKYLAFESEISNWTAWFASAAVNSIISIGDAGHERLALLRAAKGFPDCRAKSVKLTVRPTVPVLIKEHELLGTCLKPIVRHEGSLDLCLKIA
eukprot:TRINITY_DN21053_c0_g1_i2.p1 TRINITY_DN21053_c0_g1~~TRINITY_DN21053_c0_g1_i2.p1  ORF type:complete len:328 (+),score=59.16 TRINITY_DN21053_c0_g1_i2:145-984(+)